MKSVYKIDNKLPKFVTALSEEQTKKLIEKKNFDSDIDLTDKGICFEYVKVISLEKTCTEEYFRSLYEVNLPEVIDSVQISEYSLQEDDTISFHRIGVFRNGEYIDKLKDATIQVFHDEDQSMQGVFDNKKKVNVRLNQIQIGDIILFEHTTKSVFPEEKLIRKDFQKYVFEVPTFNYWIYLTYKFILINNLDRDVFYKKRFFRDEEDEVIDSDMTFLKVREQYIFEEKMYNPLPINDNYFIPFIDFSSCKEWNDVSSYLYNIYLPFYKNKNLKNDFSDLYDKIKSFSSKDQQIQFAIEFVQNNIKYIYDANEMDGHLPQDPLVTYKTKIGDCKAKALLLDLILKEINIDSNIVLVKYNLDPMLDFQLPSPLCFSHALIKIHKDEKIYFIDPTSNNIYGQLEYRSQPLFRYFLDILPNTPLKKRPVSIQTEFNSEESISITIAKNRVSFQSTIIFRKEAADNLRKNFLSGSNTSFQMLIGELLFTAMDNSHLTREEIIKAVKYKKIEDNKIQNCIIYEYTCDLENACIPVDKSEKVFKFYDRTFLNSFIQTYNHKDAQYFHDRNTSKLTLNITGDYYIATNKVSSKELEINNKYFSYSLKKEISRKSIRVLIEMKNVAHDVIPLGELKSIKEDYKMIEDNANGVGVIFSKWAFLGNKNLSSWVIYIVCFLLVKFILAILITK